MNTLFLLAETLSAPNDLWTIIINWIQGGVANYGWTILLFTLLVKVVLSPLDFCVKLTTKKQTLIQKKCAPEIAKLQKKYGADQQTIKVQTNSLYKREGLKMGVSCIVTLVNMIITMVIFFTLYASLRKVSAYESIIQYEQVEQAYNGGYYDAIINFKPDDEIVDKESADAFINKFYEAKDYLDNSESHKADEDYETKYAEYQSIYNSGQPVIVKATENALEVAANRWQEVKSNWLWIENIWVADAVTRPLPDYEGLKAIAKNGGNDYLKYVEENINKDRCDKISNEVTNKAGRTQNGYYIIAILSGVVTLLSQLISQLQNKLKNKKANQLATTSEKSMGMSMKVMMIIMPIIMVTFALTTGAGFGIYIVSSSLASIVLGEISTLIIDAITKKKRIEVEEYLEKEANRQIKKGKLKG